MDFLDPVIDAGKRAWWWLGDRVPPSVVERFERIQLQLQRLGRAVQSVVVTTLLFVLYTTGFGVSRALAAVFARRYLRLYDAPPEEGSYWKDAEGYGPDRDRLLRQF